jgi:drug/metabolite transporter (DMT)-like permease
MNKNKMTGLLLVLMTAIISGFSVYVNKFGVKETNPYVFTFVKNSIAALPFLFLAIPAYRQLKKLEIKEKVLFYLIAVVGGSIPFLLFFKGLSMATAGNANFIHKTMFIYIALFSIYFLKEKLNAIAYAGIAVLMAGSIMFFKIQPSKLGIGELYILLATLLWTAEILISKKLLSKVSANLVSVSRMFLGSILIFAYLLISGQAGMLLKLNTHQWSWLLIGGAFLFGYVITFYHGLKRLSAAEASAVITLAVPITTILTMSNQHITMTNRDIISIGLLAAGIVIIYTSNYLARIFPLALSFLRRQESSGN